MTDAILTPRRLSQRAFAAYGVATLAYLKPVREGERTVFAIFGADGTELGTASSRHAAEVALREHDMEALALH